MSDFDRYKAAIRSSVAGCEKFCMLNFVFALAVAFFLLAFKFWFDGNMALHEAIFVFFACYLGAVLLGALAFIPILKPRAFIQTAFEPNGGPATPD